MNKNQSNQKNIEEFYTNLKGKLDKVEKFPTDFTYKFIIPTSHKTIAKIQKIFDGTRPKIHTKESKNAKYTSITVVIYALDAEQVIHYYKEVGKIEGVIML